MVKHRHRKHETVTWADVVSSVHDPKVSKREKNRIYNRYIEQLAVRQQRLKEFDRAYHKKMREMS